MLSTIKQRLERDDEQGFTLIELMVVVLIIAILLAIAIPTFLGARNTANARAAQSNLRNALTAEQTYFTNNDQAFGYTATALDSIEPNLNWETSAPKAADPANSVAVGDDTAANTSVVFLVALGKDNNCYAIYQDNAGSVSNGTQTATTLYQQFAQAAGGGCTVPTTDPTTFVVGHASANAGSWTDEF
jgi:type IV pilus assembly protein PilA